MSKTREKTKIINSYVIDNVEQHDKDIVSLTAENFNISRPAAFKHIKKLLDSGVLEATGKTRNRTYRLKVLSSLYTSLELVPKLEEDTVWEDYLSPALKDILPEVHQICMYGFTEMLNNVIDHSSGSQVIISLEMNARSLSLRVLDNGVGIFNKIQQALHLEDQRHAILELAKGKLTTDPVNHSGQGIFFTSRMFDNFSILSGNLYFSSKSGNDWLIETRELSEGTFITMQIDPASERTITYVFNKYASEQEDYGFTRTHVPVSLAKWGPENLVSRSQAKRLLAGLEKFKEVMLDFDGVETIGQAFADEIFRVFANRHPEIKLLDVNTDEQVKNMISWVKSHEVSSRLNE